MTGAIVLGSEVLTMTSREIAELVDSRHDSVKRTIERLVVQGVIESPPLVDFKNINNVAGQEYVFSGEQGKRNSIIVVAQLSPEFTARLVDRWRELEAGQSAIPQTYAQALRAHADAVEAKEQAEERARIAIATKAQIGSSREATCMATASAAVRKANSLQRQLDRAKDYATVKRMQMLYHGQRFNWRLLRDASAEMGIAPVDVFDANYGTVKAYHADVWMAAYAVGIDGAEVVQ